MSTIDYSLSKKGKLRTKMQKVVIGLTLSGLVLSGTSASLFLNTTPAYAAPLAYGHGFTNPTADYILGSWITTDGKLAYCIQLQVPPPTDSQEYLGVQNAVIVGDGSTVTGDKVAQLNYVLNTWGETTNDLQAAAVSWAIWYLTDQVDDQGNYTSVVNGSQQSIFTFAGNQAQANLEWDDSTGLLSGGALYDLFLLMTSEAQEHYDDPAPGAPASITMTGATNGGVYTGTVSVPVGYDRVDITNATFDDNNSTRIVTDGDAGTFEWTSTTIPDNATSTFTVSARGDYSIAQTGENVAYWSDANGQDLISLPPKAVQSTTASFSAGLGFTPELETLVPVKRVTGDGSGTITVSDTVTFSTNSSATAPFNNGLRQFADGRYAQITSNGTLYGPLKNEPLEVSDVPLGSPVAATTSITTSSTDGFSRGYDASVEIPDLAGFYTWVWEIDAADQSETVQGLIPEDYSFQDNYGIPDETAFAPTKLTYVTDLTVKRGEPGDTTVDMVTTSVDGHWLANAAGENHPATLTGTVYYHGTTAPVQQSTVPASAEAVQTLQMTVSSEGEFPSEVITMPDTLGHYTVRWCTNENTYFEAFCDDYGVPSESFEVFRDVPPTVTTRAQTTAHFGDEVRDTAFVEGNVPDNSFLRFTAYREVFVGDPKFAADGTVIEGEFWTAEEIDLLSEEQLCSIQPIGTTGLTAVDGAGEYVSEPIKTTLAGSNHRMFWVEDLITVDPETGEETLLDQGLCGEPSEITYVEWPTITTDAGGEIMVGESRGDRTSVAYANSELTYNVTHELYFAGKNADIENPVCDATNLVFSTVDTPVSITGSEEYEFVSAAYRFDKEGTYYWIEKLFYGDQEVASGYCGNPDETVIAVLDPVDPEPTGDEFVPPANVNSTATPLSNGFLAAGALLLIAGAATALVARRVA